MMKKILSLLFALILCFTLAACSSGSTGNDDYDYLISLLDRMFFAGDCFRYKPACVVCSARRGGATATYDQLSKYLAISGMIQVPSCYWNMVHGTNKEEVVRDGEGMRNMRVLGRNMAWLLRVLEAAGKTVPLPVQDPPVKTNFIR